MTHILVSKLTIIGSDNDLSPGRRQAMILTNAGILLTGPVGINFTEIVIEINIFSIKKMYLKMLSAKWRLFRLSLNVLNTETGRSPYNIHIRCKRYDIYCMQDISLLKHMSSMHCYDCQILLKATFIYQNPLERSQTA